MVAKKSKTAKKVKNTLSKSDRKLQNVRTLIFGSIDYLESHCLDLIKIDDPARKDEANRDLLYFMGQLHVYQSLAYHLDDEY